MKRLLLLSFVILLYNSTASSQVINYGKTIPMRSISLTFSPVYNTPSDFHTEDEIEGIAFLFSGSYGLKYNLDLGLRYGNYNGPDFFSAELQYMFRETRKSYYSFYGGIHKWKEYGVDLTATFTYTPQYNVNVTAGLDMDVDISLLELRAWIPVNFGVNINDRFFFYFEYNLPVTEYSWDIIALGATYIIR